MNNQIYQEAQQSSANYAESSEVPIFKVPERAHQLEGDGRAEVVYIEKSSFPYQPISPLVKRDDERQFDLPNDESPFYKCISNLSPLKNSIISPINRLKEDPTSSMPLGFTRLSNSPMCITDYCQWNSPHIFTPNKQLGDTFYHGLYSNEDAFQKRFEKKSTQRRLDFSGYVAPASQFSVFSCPAPKIRDSGFVQSLTAQMEEREETKDYARNEEMANTPMMNPDPHHVSPMSEAGTTNTNDINSDMKERGGEHIVESPPNKHLKITINNEELNSPPGNDPVDDVDDPNHRILNKKLCCNCKKSRCLKLYCDCFAKGVYCDGCNCINCYNTKLHEKERQLAITATLDRNPTAFNPKIGLQQAKTNQKIGSTIQHFRGCHCKKSGCLKKYCECYQVGAACTELCKCEGCKNKKGHFVGKQTQYQPLRRSQKKSAFKRKRVSAGQNEKLSQEFSFAEISDPHTGDGKRSHPKRNKKNMALTDSESEGIEEEDHQLPEEPQEYPISSEQKEGFSENKNERLFNTPMVENVGHRNLINDDLTPSPVRPNYLMQKKKTHLHTISEEYVEISGELSHPQKEIEKSVSKSKRNLRKRAFNKMIKGSQNTDSGKKKTRKTRVSIEENENEMIQKEMLSKKSKRGAIDDKKIESSHKRGKGNPRKALFNSFN